MDASLILTRAAGERDHAKHGRRGAAGGRSKWSPRRAHGLMPTRKDGDYSLSARSCVPHPRATRGKSASS